MHCIDVEPESSSFVALRDEVSLMTMMTIIIIIILSCLSGDDAWGDPL
jgi:hypothetical protein